LLEHGGLAHLVRAQQEAYAIRAGSRVLQFSSISFDASLYEIVQALWSGATLVLAEQERVLPGAKLAKLLRAEAITHLTIPPSALARLTPQDFPDLKQIIVAGEACPAELVARWAKGRQFINAYGPTETTSWATWMSCQDTTRRPPIGRPLHNTEVYLLNDQLQPVVNGDTGELYIGGASLVRGYLHRPT
jgi:non-ribosomal peptide synthetase component F